MTPGLAMQHMWCPQTSTPAHWLASRGHCWQRLRLNRTAFAPYHGPEELAENAMWGLISGLIFWVGVPLVFIASLYGAVLAHQSDLKRRNGKKYSVAVYAAGVLGAGIFAVFGFWTIIIPVACWLSGSSSPGCGMFDALLLTPVAFAVGVAVFASSWHWLRKKSASASAKDAT